MSRKELAGVAILIVGFIVIVTAMVVSTTYAIDSAEASEAIESIEITGDQTLQLQLNPDSDLIEPGAQVTLVDDTGERVLAQELVPNERTITVGVDLGEYTVTIANGDESETVRLEVGLRHV